MSVQSLALLQFLKATVAQAAKRGGDTKWPGVLYHDTMPHALFATCSLTLR